MLTNRAIFLKEDMVVQETFISERSRYGNRPRGLCLQNGNNKDFLFIYAYIKIFRAMMKCVREDDSGGVFLFIRGV